MPLAAEPEVGPDVHVDVDAETELRLMLVSESADSKPVTGDKGRPRRTAGESASTT